MKYKSLLLLLSFLIENFLKMRKRIHKRLPIQFVQEVLGAFNGQQIPVKDTMELLGIGRSGPQETAFE